MPEDQAFRFEAIANSSSELLVRLTPAPGYYLYRDKTSFELAHADGVAAILRDVPEVKGIVARSGADELGLDPMGINQTDVFMVLKPRDQWRAMGVQINWEDTELTCAHTGERIQSAYGDD